MAKNTRKFQFTLGKTGFISFILGMGALVFVFFLLGIKMGAYLDTYPEKLVSLPVSLVRYLGLAPEAKQAANEAAALFSAEKSLPPVEESDSPPAPDKLPADSPVGQAASGENTPDKNLIQEAAIKPPAAEGSNLPAVIPPATTPKEVPLPQTPIKNSGSAKPKDEPAGKYLIQVVAFREKEKATKFGEVITRLGYKSEIEITEHDDSGAWFRVVIRNFKTADEAKKVASRLSAKVKGVNCVIRLNEP